MRRRAVQCSRVIDGSQKVTLAVVAPRVGRDQVVEGIVRIA